jgi:hypothetical protein
MLIHLRLIHGIRTCRAPDQHPTESLVHQPLPYPPHPGSVFESSRRQLVSLLQPAEAVPGGLDSQGG